MTIKISPYLRKLIKKVVRKSIENEQFKNRTVRTLNFVIQNLPSESYDYLKVGAIKDILVSLKEVLNGAYLYKSHSFAEVLGDTKIISFVFPYYKKEEDLIRAIKSLNSQTLNTLKRNDFEIIVVDDGSLDLIDDRLPDDVLYIRRNKFKYGISRSRNLGAKISSGRVLVFVDPDFIFPNNYVETLYSEYKMYGSNTIISGYIYDYFYEGCDDPRKAFGVWENPNRKCKRFLQLAGGHMVIDRNIFFNIGGFDEDLIYGEVEDTYFGYQLSQYANLSIVFSTKLWVKHVPHPVGLAHQSPSLSYSVAASKCPEFFWDYVINNQR